MAEPSFTIAILLPQTPPAPLFAALPKSDERVHILLIPIEADIEAVDVSSITAILWVPPSPAARLTALFDRVGAEQLRWIHALSTGVDHLGEFLASRLVPTAVPLTNGRGAFSSSLAEYAVAACLQHNKEFVRCAGNRLEKRWDKFTMGTLRGRTMGFVGFGDIAKETAKLAAPFGMRLIALRRHPQKAAAEQQLLTPGAAPLLEATYGSEDAATFYAQCDFVVCSLPLTPETRKLIGRAAFGAMKSSTYFVSLGRGAVIDEEALYEALQGGKLAGAACDVFTTEPLPVESPLWTCENLLLTAHNADLTEDYFELALAKWRQNLDACLEGKPWVTPVDVALGY